MKKVESAGGVILNELNEVAIVFTDTKSWQFPKGTVEKGEGYFDTAIREIEEETGLKDLKLIKKLPVYSRVSTHENDTKRFIHYFLFSTKKQNLNPNAEVSDCKWIPIDTVENELTYPEDKKFIISQRINILDSNEAVKKVFITGVSGVGKTTVMNELLKRGYQACDTDKSGLSIWVDKTTGLKVEDDTKHQYGTKEWFDAYLWTLLPDKVMSIQETNPNKTIFFCGSPGNALEISKIFDKVICLTLDDDTLKKRVMKRKSRYPNELGDILIWNKTFAKKFKDIDAELIDASGDVQKIVDAVILAC